MPKRDWLERWNFRPDLQDSRDNPFIRQYIQKRKMFGV